MRRCLPLEQCWLICQAPRTPMLHEVQWLRPTCSSAMPSGLHPSSPEPSMTVLPRQVWLAFDCPAFAHFHFLSAAQTASMRRRMFTA